MAATARRSKNVFLEGFYKIFVRRTSVYSAFVIGGALLGERLVDRGTHKIWDYNNVGKRFEDISVLGTKQSEG